MVRKEADLDDAACASIAETKSDAFVVSADPAAKIVCEAPTFRYRSDELSIQSRLQFCPDEALLLDFTRASGCSQVARPEIAAAILSYARPTSVTNAIAEAEE